MISAIIPAWCEAAAIGDGVTAARAVADEVIVADANARTVPAPSRGRRARVPFLVHEAVVHSWSSA